MLGSLAMPRPARGLVLLALALALPRLAFAADPFYERLLQKGKRALATDTREAMEDLRLACFGLLEEPPALADCLVHLAVAQTSNGDDEAFRETSGRLVELEASFEVYGDLELAPSVREIFESRLETMVTYESLADLPTLRHVAQKVLETELTTLSSDERRQRLEGLRKREPDELRWLIMMSEVELEGGNYNAALEMSTLALRRDTELLRAICVRGRAQAALGNCDEAMVDLVSCGRDAPERDVDVTMDRLRCRVQQQAWDEAQSLLDQLETKGISTAETRRLARDVRRGRRQTPPPAASSTAPPIESIDEEEASPEAESGSSSGG